MRKSVLIGILSAVFFTSTFVINRSINLDGGSYLWGASLRYLFSLLLLIPLLKKGSFSKILNCIKKDPKYWFIYSTIGFGFFYISIAAASSYGESWMAASFWQLTIVCGILLSPLTGHKIPKKPLLLSLFIILGVILLQLDNLKHAKLSDSISILLLSLLAAICYPLGNRKMMQFVQDDLNTTERVYGMTLMSTPFWLIISGIAYYKDGLPSKYQLFQIVLVTILSSIIATLLFFKATDMEKDNSTGLALVESTISAEIPFALLAGVFILNDRMPSSIGLLGMVFTVLGIVLSTIIKDE